MAKVELIMPKMGESIIEATILKWTKKVGETVNQDETILEIATDKVDSEIPSPVSGVLTEVLFPEESVVSVGKVIAIIQTDGESAEVVPSPAVEMPASPSQSSETLSLDMDAVSKQIAPMHAHSGDRFYSPLVRNMAKEENISASELDAIQGSGANGRVTKQDMLLFIQNRQKGTYPQPQQTITTAQQHQPDSSEPAASPGSPASVQSTGNVEIVEMDRMRRLIADHMVMSKQTSPHVTSFVESDVTNMVQWREKNKKKFLEKYGENITFTPLFIHAIVRAIKEFPMINISLDGNRILVKKDIHIGMAAALPSGNLIVPVVKNADLLNLAGLARSVNDLASRARQNKLKPEEIKDGTFTLTNVGTFGNLMGTPIINQPQVAIMATGAIKKKPAVLETPYGDVIAIRHLMFLSMSYDHRVVDGSLGGAFLKRVSDLLESFDPNTEV
jgi:2-oxoglutarate dehydrogenase E2 component (dihydrolipoamide succinyltransferase)